MGSATTTKLLVPRGEMSLLQITRQARVRGRTAIGGDWPGGASRWWSRRPAAPESQPPEQVSIVLHARRRLASGAATPRSSTKPASATSCRRWPSRSNCASPAATIGWVRSRSSRSTGRRSARSKSSSRRPGSEPSERRGTQSAKRRAPALAISARDAIGAATGGQRAASNRPRCWTRDCRSPAGNASTIARIRSSWTMKESLALEFRLIGQRGGLSSKPYFPGDRLAQGSRAARHDPLVGRRPAHHARGPHSAVAAGHRRFWRGVAGARSRANRRARRQAAGRNQAHDVKMPRAGTGRMARTEIELAYELELRERGLAPGNMLKLRGAATDACALGAQAGNSRWLAFQIVIVRRIVLRNPDAPARTAGQVQRRVRQRQGAGQRRWLRWPSREDAVGSLAPSKSSAARFGKWPINSTPRSRK